MHKARETLLKHMGKVPPLKDQTDPDAASEPRTGDLDATR